MMGTPRPTRMPIRALEATSTRCQRSSPACRFGDLWFHRAVVTSHPTWPPVAHQQRDDHLVSVRSVELSWLLIDQVASARSSLRTAPSGRASLQRSGMPGAAMLSVAGRCPPFGVHPFASDVRGPVSPAVRCPAVRCPISWFRGPGSGRPAGWCPPVRCPAGWCRPVRPVTSVSSTEARRWPWGSRRCCGQPSRLQRIELHVVCGVRAARSTA
jgi:hypothetical protein